MSDLEWFCLQSIDPTTILKTLNVKVPLTNIYSTRPEMMLRVLAEWANIWSWHQPCLNLAHLLPVSYYALLRRKTLLRQTIPPLPSLTFHISLWEKKKKKHTVMWEIPWRPEIVIISPLHSSIPNTFLQKQIYGNPLRHIHCCCQSPLSAAKHAFSLCFVFLRRGTTALCSVIITSNALRFTI